MMIHRHQKYSQLADRIMYSFKFRDIPRLRNGKIMHVLVTIHEGVTMPCGRSSKQYLGTR
jgi:hypothetical protein